LSYDGLAREGSVGQAGYPADLIEAWTGPVAVPRSVIVAATGSTNKNTLLLDQEPTASTTRAAKPGTHTLVTSEGPLLLDLHDLGLPTVGEGDLRVTSKTSNPDTWMVLQELVMPPFPTGMRTTRTEASSHLREKNLRTAPLYLYTQKASGTTEIGCTKDSAAP